MNLLILGGLALVTLIIVWLVGRSSRRSSGHITHSELVERVKRLP